MIFRLIRPTLHIFIMLLSTGLEPSSAQTVISPSGKWVTDTADMLSDAEERTLSAKLASYADTTSTQIIIVTIPSVEGAIEEYAVELGRRWGVGQQGQDNGVVILVLRDDRDVFIATGYGLEGAIPDAIASRIVRNVIVPNFRSGNYYAGLSEAADHLIAAARGEFSAEQIGTPRQGERTFDGATLFILMIIAYFAISAMRHRGGGGSDGGRRYRRGHGGPPIIIWGGGHRGGFGGGGFGGGGFGGFGGGGGSFGGGGAGGSW
jgi:uncharacterized protein